MAIRVAINEIKNNSKLQTFNKLTDPREGNKSKQITRTEANHLIRTTVWIPSAESRPPTHRFAILRADLPRIYEPCPRISRSLSALTKARIKEEGERGAILLFLFPRSFSSLWGAAASDRTQRFRPICPSGAAAPENTARGSIGGK